jgi:integrase
MVICPECSSSKTQCDGHRFLKDGTDIQRYSCKCCGYRFSEKSYKECQTNTKRQICALKVKNLEPQTETKTVAGENPDIKGKLLQFAFYCKKEGMTDATIKTFNGTMKRLAKIANLNNSENVKEAIARMKVEENTKVSYCVAYTVFLNFLGKTWKTPKYKYRQKLPEFLPTEEEINQLIAGCGNKTGTLLQLIKETGMRIGECLSLKWICVNFEKRIITLTDAEKHSLPRIFRVSNTLISMIGNLLKVNDKVFGLTTRCIAENCLRNSRKKVARKLGTRESRRFIFT